MTKLERKRRGRKTENRVRIAIFLVILAVIGSGSYVYAKYFSEAAKWGVAIASSVYFSANYAAESDDFFESSVSYPGGNFDFDFEVRNYENNLLFNESSVVIPYSVSFWLEATPSDNAVYAVKSPDSEGEATQIGVGIENAVTFDGQSIAGGAALANAYTISISGIESGITHKATSIYVLVETAEGAGIDKTLRGKMTPGASKKSDLQIESGFIVPDGDEDEFERIQKVSMFSYEIRTVGEPATGDVTEKLKLSWNPALLEMDMFDDAYATPTQETVDGVDWYYIMLDIMPYSSQTIGFLRGESFATEVTDMATMEAAVKVAVITE